MLLKTQSLPYGYQKVISYISFLVKYFECLSVTRVVPKLRPYNIENEQDRISNDSNYLLK